MARSRSFEARKGRRPVLSQKPSEQLVPRVQAVGPEHFGILAVDCAKHRSRCLLTDFYGQVLQEPTTFVHCRGQLQATIDRVRQAMQQHGLADMVVAIEQTGQYHRPVQRAFRAANFDTRLVHPFTSKQYRQPADPDYKTDDADLPAIGRAASHGFGLADNPWPDAYVSIQLLRRHRRDLVDKTADLYRQIREVLHAAMPGYAECFCHLWDDSPTPLVMARHTTSPDAVRQAGFAGLQGIARDHHLTCRDQTLHKILAWAEQAPPAHPHPLDLRRCLIALDDDRLLKTQQILDLERDLAHLVVRTPYILLLAIPGINIVSVADLAGELGPIQFYANANGITGRAGLAPSRYQSDEVDRPNGPLRRHGNRRLRAVLMQTADNLAHCNHYFRARAQQWTGAGKDPRWLRVKIAKNFSRLAFAIVSGGQLFPHPCRQPRHYVLGKLLEFHADHATAPQDMRRDLAAVVELLPEANRVEEAQPLQQQLEALAQRRRGPQLLAEIIPFVLARLGVPQVQSDADEGAGP